jgi:U3 small nucleolar ribonucleoprotein component
MNDDDDRQSIMSDDVLTSPQTQQGQPSLPLDAEEDHQEDMDQEEDEEEIDESEAEVFALVEDKHLASKVLLARWCPAMDLLAIFTADKLLSVHRLNWEPLW